MGYEVTGFARSLTILIYKRAYGSVVSGYPKIYDGKTNIDFLAYYSPLYSSISDDEMAKMSLVDFNARLNDFKAWLETVEYELDFDTAFILADEDARIASDDCTTTTTSTSTSSSTTTTTTTTTIIYCESPLCETALTVGTDGEGNYGFLRGFIGNIYPDCGSINAIGYFALSGGWIDVVFADNTYCDITLWIDSIEYQLGYVGHHPEYGGYVHGLQVGSNPLPSVGETCDVIICGIECTTTTTTTIEPTTTTTTTLEPTTTTTTTCDPSKCDYGLLYNWYAVNTGKLAPTGWHIPSDTEYTTLSTYLGGASIAGGKMKTTSICDWLFSNVGATNDSGFCGQPCGHRSYHTMSFLTIGETCFLWTANKVLTDTAWSRQLFDYSSEIGRSHNNIKQGYSVRCVRDSYEEWENDVPVVDYDGNEYDVVEIGTQLWLVQNLKVTHYNDGEAIPNVEDNTTWAELTTGALCAYDNDWETYACVDKPTTTTTTTVEPTTTTTTTSP